MKESQKTRILRRLSSGKSVHFSFLNDICYRYSARIYELRKMGFAIDTEDYTVSGRREVYYRLNTPLDQIDFDKTKLKVAV